MVDFYYQLRQKMIRTMQLSLRQIRQVLNFGVQEFGELIGLTRQTINNLETRKNNLSSTQYIAICAVIDNFVKEKPELLPILSKILTSNEENTDLKIFETIDNGSLLKKWFLCFPDESKMIGLSKENSFIEKYDIDNIAQHYRVFLDNTALLNEGFESAVQNLTLSMKQCNNKYIIPLKTIEAIQQQLMSSNQHEISIAQRGIQTLMNMQNDDVVEIRGETNDVNNISTFVSVFAKFKWVNRLALITCDEKLATQIDALNNDDFGGFNILILKCSKENGLEKWDLKNNLNQDKLNSINSDSTHDYNTISQLKGWSTIE